MGWKERDKIVSDYSRAIRAKDARIKELERMVVLFANCEDSGTRAKLREELHVPDCIARTETGGE